jgi:thiamine-monophosphate kinase
VLDEFGRIARFFAPLSGPGALGLLDDAAVIDVPPGRQLVLTADAIIEGVHFLPDDPPNAIARKLLRVNLSDLAAMGAAPMAYLMTTALPDSCDEAWLAEFSAGLAADQAEFGIFLLGGDSVAITGPIALSLTAIGTVASGDAVCRSGARPGDLVCVSGTLGDAALGLRARLGELSGIGDLDRAFLIDHYRLPQPRLRLGRELVGSARAMTDISDGLVADLEHLCAASGVGAVIDAAALPLSDAARKALAVDPRLLTLVLGGGDDYELLFAVSPEREADIAALSRLLGIGLTPIGRFEGGPGVCVLDADGREIPLASRGYRHF